MVTTSLVVSGRLWRHVLCLPLAWLASGLCGRGRYGHTEMWDAKCSGGAGI